MKTIITALSAIVVVLVSSCAQPPPGCQVSSSAAYTAKYAKTAGDGVCGALLGDQLGMASYNPPNKDGTAPDLSKVSLAIRTNHLGTLVATAHDQGVDDTTAGDKPHSFGPFTTGIPDADICTPSKLDPAHQVLAALPGDVGDPEDPDDDIPSQAAVDTTEEWTGVKVYVTAAAIGTQLKGHYKITDNVAGCSAEYDVLAVFPAVSCEEVVPDGAPLDLASIDDNVDHTVTIVTAPANTLAVGDAFEIAGTDNDQSSFDGPYTVASIDAATNTIVTAEIDPFDGDEPDPAVLNTGTLQKLKSQGNPDLCSADAIPEKGIAVGSGISPDFPVVCDPDLLACALNADPTTGTFPVLKK